MHFPLHLTHLTESTPGDGSQHGHLFSAHSASPSAGDDVVERERERKGGGGGGGGECSSTSTSVGKDEEQEQEREQEQKREQEQEQREKEEEEVSEWIEGKDIVIERKSCIPGEDVQVEVLKGAAVVVVEGGERERERMVREAKERMRKKGKEAEGKW